MFTWICPDCGREVPPSYNDCPDCAAKSKPPAQEVAKEVANDPASVVAAPPPPPPPVRSVPAPPRAVPASSIGQSLPPLRETPQRFALPAWLMTIISALAFVGVGAGAYFAITYFKKEPAARSNTVALEAPPAAAPGKGNPLAKQIEIAGLRLTQNQAKKTEV